MDNRNRFDTPTTHRLVRAEYGVALAISVGLFAVNIRDINWLAAIFLFAYIDVIGYLPGAIAFARSKTKEIPRIYYVLYNTMHSFLTHALVVGAWAALDGFQWAFLAIPIHLCGDRFLFGNFLKPFNVPFEPHAVDAFTVFERQFASGRTDSAEISGSHSAKTGEPAEAFTP